MLSATPNEGQYSANTLNVDLGGRQAYIYMAISTNCVDSVIAEVAAACTPTITPI